MLQPPENPGSADPQAPPCARTFGVRFFEELMREDQDPRARALHRTGLRACATTPWPAIPRDTGATLWFPQLPGVKRKLLEFQERERTESGDGWLEGWERGEGRVPRGHLTSISERRPQHPVSGPRREAAATRGPWLGSRGWEIYS